MIEVSEGHIGHIERGSRAPSVEILIHIAAALEVSIDELLVDLNYSHNDRTDINKRPAVSSVLSPNCSMI